MVFSKFVNYLIANLQADRLLALADVSSIKHA